MTRPIPLLLVTIAATFGLAGCGGDDQADDTRSVEGVRVLETIELHETEYSIRPRTIRLERVAFYGFKVTNDGEEPHALRITGRGLDRRSGPIEPGDSKTIAVFLKKDGTYRVWCPLDGHAGKGMRATVVVG